MWKSLGDFILTARTNSHYMFVSIADLFVKKKVGC